MEEQFDRAVVAGGLGAVGRFFADLLGREATVTRVDPRAVEPGPGILADDIRAPGGALSAALASADVVVLALPEPVALEAVPAVAAHLRPGTLLVDTLSVKSGVVPVLRQMAQRHGLAAISVNPMFAPDLGARGRPVATVEVAPGARADRMRRLLAHAGAVPILLTAEQHDRLCAAVQVATHASVLAFGATLRSLGLDPADLLAVAPPPHRTMLGLLARVTSASPQVYHDIQVANPGAAGVRATLSREVDRLTDLAATPRHFAAHLEDLAQWLGPHRVELAAQCASAFLAFPTDAVTETDGPEPVRHA